MPMTEQTISLERLEETINVFGSFDENIRIIEREMEVTVVSRDSMLKVAGEDPEGVMHAVKAIENLMTLASKGEVINEQNVRYIVQLVREGKESQIVQLAGDVICVTAKGKPIKAKTLGQKRYVEAIKNNVVTLGIGPAGTGKTYLAVAAAVAAFRAKEINRIILTRPAVEAGERLGFLPGDLQSKVDPYLRPLYDALFEMLGPETYQKYLERGNIEVAPLAYMRGRTLDDSFIILDEAQNTSREQMKMFLTRLGFGSKIVITGDITQIDLPVDKVSGLREAMRVLKGVEDIAILRLGEADVVQVFIEPVSVVDANNEIKVLEGREREEIQRILFELSVEAGTFAESIKHSYSNAVMLNLIFAKAHLAYKMKASKPILNNDGIIELKKARHPLLNPKTVVPTDITLGESFDTLVITGPNTGGKTVSIKTIGLLTLMTMCGMLIPVADQSRISVFGDVLVDVGDEQSIQQNLSTFSSHMVNIISIMKKANESSLVLIDELGAGTDPVEGAALAVAIIENIRSKGARIAATTHYAELKAYALET